MAWLFGASGFRLPLFAFNTASVVPIHSIVVGRLAFCMNLSAFRSSCPVFHSDSTRSRFSSVDETRSSPSIVKSSIQEFYRHATYHVFSLGTSREVNPRGSPHDLGMQGRSNFGRCFQCCEVRNKIPPKITSWILTLAYFFYFINNLTQPCLDTYLLSYFPPSMQLSSP